MSIPLDPLSCMILHGSRAASRFWSGLLNASPGRTDQGGSVCALRGMTRHDTHIISTLIHVCMVGYLMWENCHF